MRLNALVMIAGLLVGMLATQIMAQNRFSPVIQVGDRIITQYQLDQRARFLALLRAPGDPRDIARQQLINEAVQLRAGSSFGIEVSPEELLQSQSEFASRANLTLEEFVTAIQQNGVAAETYRDFVHAGVVWRAVIQGLFQDTASNVPLDQIERTFAQTGTEGGLRVLISEILLPASTPETALASRERAAELAALDNEADFAAAARQYSVAESRARGGEQNWVSIETLPESIRGIISALSPGQISRPVELPNAIGVFLVRNIERVDAGTPENLSVDYALFITDGDRNHADAITSQIDTCDDLYGVAQGMPEERLIRELQPLGALPSDIRSAVGTLDIGEATTTLTRNGRGTVLMLCSRLPSLESSVDIDIVGNRLVNSRLTALAANYLAELRANSTIIELTN
ncbi:MAG: peptidylprolyl isomerase [Boseongicola sp.]